MKKLLINKIDNGKRLFLKEKIQLLNYLAKEMKNTDNAPFMCNIISNKLEKSNLSGLQDVLPELEAYRPETDRGSDKDAWCYPDTIWHEDSYRKVKLEAIKKAKADINKKIKYSLKRKRNHE